MSFSDFGSEAEPSEKLLNQFAKLIRVNPLIWSQPYALILYFVGLANVFERLTISMFCPDSRPEFKRQLRSNGMVVI